MFLKGEHTKTWKWLRRPLYEELARDSHNLRGYTREAERIASLSKITHEFTIEPNAWLWAFGMTDSPEQDRWK